MLDEVASVTAACGKAGGAFGVILALLEVLDHGRILRGGMSISGSRRRSAADEVNGLVVNLSEFLTSFRSTAGACWRCVCAIDKAFSFLLPRAQVVSLV